jgi:nucleoside phosphorylase
LDATVAILTALPEEQAAVEAALGCQRVMIESPRCPIAVSIAAIQGRGGAPHVVVVNLLDGMGNVLAAAGCSDLFHACEKLRYVLMVGIAGAVPDPGNGERHVRLGDIVVLGGKGVVQFDLGKLDGSDFKCRSNPKPPGSYLAKAVRQLEVRDIRNDRPWETRIADVLSDGLNDGSWKRPGPEHDVLQDGNQPVVVHPDTPGRRDGHPKVFVGPIGSSDAVIKNADKRERLRVEHGVMAVEMEGAGVAEVCALKNLQYLVIRGTVDYCNDKKSDRWRRYAALIAAAYSRSVLEELPGSLGASASVVPFDPGLREAISAAKQRETRPPPQSEDAVHASGPAGTPTSGLTESQVTIRPPTPPVTEDTSDPTVAQPVSGTAPASVKRPAQEVEQEGRVFRDRLTNLRVNLELDAYSAAEDVLRWFDAHWREISSGLAVGLLEELILIEGRRSIQAAGPNGTPDTSHAKRLLERLANVR